MQSNESRPKRGDLNETSPRCDAVIGRYRWALVASHAVALLYFLDTNILTVLTKDAEPLCWPYFQNCWQFRFDKTSSVAVLILIQVFLIISAASTLAARCYRTFWVVMVVMNAYLFAIVSLDYRLRGNQFYMLFWLNAVVLFWPAKRWAIPLILTSFYFWAGTLKLNYEWLSGAVLYHNLYIVPPRFVWLACAYVVVLEMIVIWGLLAKRAWVRWLALGQLALFHFESLSQIHWFYPLLMASLLSWFVIDWSAPGSPRTASLGDLWRGRAPGSAYILLAIFSICQLTPYLYHGDKMLTGQGRILALDMLEARQVCDVHALVHYKDHTSYTIDLVLPELPPRKICDPLVYYDRVTNLCRSSTADPRFADVDFVMHSRRTTDAALTTIVDEMSFCSRHETYSMFSNNSWIR
jgi:hypothetical protein